MIKINPSRTLTHLDGEQLRTGDVKDSKERLKLAAMKDAAAKAPAGEQNVLEEHYFEALKNAQPLLTVGTVICAVLQAILEGDNKIEAKVKVERDDLCIEVVKAERNGQLVELSPENIVLIKERTAKLYNTRVVGQVVRILEGKDAPPVGQASDNDGRATAT